MLTAALLGVVFLQAQGSPQNGAAPPPSTVVTQKANKAEEQHQKDLQGDIDMGKKFSAEVEKQEKLSENKEFQERVNRVGQEIAAIAQTTQVNVIWGDPRLNKFTYTFKVLKDPPDHPGEVNAFSLPGGFIYVYEGLIKYTESDDELAAVLAHEVSHAEERHIWQLGKDQQKIQSSALVAIVAALVTRNPELIGAAFAVGVNAVQAFTSAWSVRAEQAADHGGIQYLIHSKYNPTAMLTFMERLSLDEFSDSLASRVDWGIYRTHPPSRDRAEATLADMQRYGIPVQRSIVCTRFRAESRFSRDGGIEVWFNKRKLYTFYGDDAHQRAEEASDRLNKFFDQEPNLFDVVFDGKEIRGKGTLLIDVQPQDAAAAKTSLEAIGDKTVKMIRGSLYNYALNVWGSR